jgi:cation diffusion facilitator CzcD-associated flavoprotein CzcO
MAINLLRAGFDDLVVLEKGPTVGGVWRENRYPGAAVDVPSDLYSYSFERRYPFSKRFGDQEQLLAYIQHCADKYGVTPHLRVNTLVERAVFEDDGWRIELADGDPLRADVVIAACGQLSVPEPPRIPGVGTFDGPAFHSAHWPQDLDVAGKRLAVIGTGASAVQIVPAVADATERVDVYQRTPPWVIPKWDAEGVEDRSLLTYYGGRLTNWLFFEALIPGFTWPPAMNLLKGVALAQRRIQLRDRGLRAKVTPDYPMGCKRILVTADWYPALMRDDVDLITEPIETITPTGIRAGIEREYDAIVYATGFQTSDPVAPMQVFGVDGVNLSTEAWKEGAEAYLGISVPGFPNLFLMYGPNTNLGAGSIIYMLECQMRYVVDAMRRLRERELAWIDVREGPHRAFCDEMQRRLTGSVWESCDSWYRAPSGRITNNWPGLMTEYRARTRRVRPAHYRAAPRSATGRAARR